MQLLEELGVYILPCLGKLPAKRDNKVFLFEKYYTAPTYPAAQSWSDKITNLGMMGNDLIGDCTFATAGHAVQLWSANNGNQIIIDDKAIIKGYSDVSGYNTINGLNDNGAVELDVLSYLRNTGIDGHKILAYTQIQQNRVDLIKAAISIFGCVRLCAQMPISVQYQSIWTDPKGNLQGGNAPGSWGGHSFLGCAYDETYVYVISWGTILKVEWGWFLDYGDEVHAAFSMDWLNNNLAPNNINLELLQTDLNNLK